MFIELLLLHSCCELNTLHLLARKHQTIKDRMIDCGLSASCEEVQMIYFHLSSCASNKAMENLGILAMLAAAILLHKPC